MSSCRGRKFMLVGLIALLATAGCGRDARSEGGRSSARQLEANAPPPAGSVQVLRLDQRLGEAVVRRPEEHVRFVDARDRQLLGSGWGGLEVDSGGKRGFAWVVGTSAEVPIRLVPAGDVELSFTCRPFRFAEAPTQVVTVALDDTELGRVTLGPRLDTYFLRVPARLIASASRLRFSFAWAERPADRIPGSSDTRRLAAAFYAIDLATPGAAEAPRPRQQEDGFVQASGTEVAFPLRVPPGGMLELGAEAVADGAPAAAAEAQVWLRHPQREEERMVFVRTTAHSDKRWLADLTPFAGEDVALVFRVVAPPGEQVLWRRPRLLADGGRIDVRNNLVLVVVDTLRADHLSCYGGSAKTPAMDALAASGVRFDCAYSHVPITLPSHSTMFTSQIPREHGVHNNGDVLSPEHLTLAEVMRENYRDTAAFVSLGVLKAKFGVAQGFETYDDTFGLDWWKRAGEIDKEVFQWLDGKPPEPFFLWVHYSDPHEPYAPPGDAYPEIGLRLNGRPAGSFAANSSTTDIHLQLKPGTNRLVLLPPTNALEGPLSFPVAMVDPPIVKVELAAGFATDSTNKRNPTLVARPPATVLLHNPAHRIVSARIRLVCKAPQSVAQARAAYSREVEYTDTQLGRLMDRLRADGLLDHTLVVLTADHGEGLGDHVQMAHVDQLYDAQVHVPLIFSFPGVLPEGRVVSDTVSHLDLLPTIDRLLRLDDRGIRRGRDLTPLMAEGAHEPAPPVYLETFRPQAAFDRRGLVVGTEKLIVTLPDRREELYDLGTDPGERDNLIRKRRPRAEAMERELEALVEAADEHRQRPAIKSNLSDEDRQLLKSLGYL